jgi:hypothetical protein
VDHQPEPANLPALLPRCPEHGRMTLANPSGDLNGQGTGAFYYCPTVCGASVMLVSSIDTTADDDPDMVRLRYQPNHWGLAVATDGS